jgi:rfaE bifunctional protein kinase chain/domain
MTEKEAGETTTSADLVGRLSGFAGKRVLVLGDMVADEYIVGRPMRISREAPVLVLHHSQDFVRPGGAANVAYNLAALGAATAVAGVIGKDSSGDRLRQALAELGIDTIGLLTEGGRRTATKTRVVGRGTQEIQQQIVRIDRVDVSHLDHDTSSRLISVVEDALGNVDAVVISDYENGVISPDVVESCLPAARQRDVLVAVDSHGDLFRFHGATVATPNQPEAEATLGRQINDLADLEHAGRELLDGMGASGILLTRGSEGMSLFERDKAAVHIPPSNLREVFDPTGAGDTTCAVFTLALISGAKMADAAILSNLAAGEVVKKLGAATVSIEDLARLAK